MANRVARVQAKKLKHSKVQGPVKSFLMGTAGFIGVSGGVMLVAGDYRGVPLIGVGIGLGWAVSKIPDRDRFEG